MEEVVGPGLACWFVVEPPAGIEPATHPYHRCAAAHYAAQRFTFPYICTGEKHVRGVA